MNNLTQMVLPDKNNKIVIKLTLVAFALLTILFIAYGLFFESYDTYELKDLGSRQVFTVHPKENNNNNFILKVSGWTNEYYKVKLNFYSGSGNKEPYHSETITIPYGDITGTFVRDFYGNINEGKVEAIYIPTNSKVNGELEISLGIF